MQDRPVQVSKQVETDRTKQQPEKKNMILPVIINDGQGPPPADTATRRLAALSELVLQVPDGGAGAGADVIAGYKAFLGEFGCRVGPFDVLSEDKDAQVKGCFVLLVWPFMMLLGCGAWSWNGCVGHIIAVYQ